jgi:hypothetical protein
MLNFALTLFAALAVAGFASASPEPLPAPPPKMVTITTDDLSAMIDAAVAKALDKRFPPSGVITAASTTAGTCGAAAASYTYTESATESTGTGRVGLFGRLRARRAGGSGGIFRRGSGGCSSAGGCS